MSTLQELIEQDLGFAADTQHTKVASDNSADQETNQLMAELGLMDEQGNEKMASEQPDQEHEKVAGQLSVDSIYNEFFPEDSELNSEKTAEDYKLASYQEAVGSRAFDHYAVRFDRRIEKMAADMLTGSSTISSPTDTPMNMDTMGDSRPPQTNPGNRPADAGDGIDTAPDVEDIVSAGNRKGPSEVGTQEQTGVEKSSMNHLAMQKIMLKQQLQS